MAWSAFSGDLVRRELLREVVAPLAVIFGVVDDLSAHHAVVLDRVDDVRARFALADALDRVTLAFEPCLQVFIKVDFSAFAELFRGLLIELALQVRELFGHLPVVFAARGICSVDCLQLVSFHRQAYFVDARLQSRFGFLPRTFQRGDLVFDLCLSLILRFLPDLFDGGFMIPPRLVELRQQICTGSLGGLFDTGLRADLGLLMFTLELCDARLCRSFGLLL